MQASVNHVTTEVTEDHGGLTGSGGKSPYRVDLIVEDTVIVELKAVNKLLPVHEAQLLSYLKLSKRQVGLLINFHVTRLRDGIKRMVN